MASKKIKKKGYSKKSSLPSKKSSAVKKTAAKKSNSKELKPITFNENERQIIRMVCDEMNSGEIAENTGLGKRTIEEYRGNIIQKMKVKNVAGLVVYAIKYRLYKIR